ncbi:hypothetical protein MBT42_18500 [Streptomyces sp. MBT42]|uniref:hypothetical protein n=1 Tax=Streptomyces sp. MBT42 TaxID=1488373 RepID=UPI001E586ABC|nr:hypothetical protein [Streptomyces sp. MBT42]MCD2461985.1 hypothetical protein [Streptomyces sp. MBT42]MCD2465548.1 hypothetical protein [Streptomyces sp. MBT42]
MATPPERPPVEPMPDRPLLPVATPVDVPTPPGEAPPEDTVPPSEPAATPVA